MYLFNRIPKSERKKFLLLIRNKKDTAVNRLLKEHRVNTDCQTCKGKTARREWLDYLTKTISNEQRNDWAKGTDLDEFEA